MRLCSQHSVITMMMIIINISSYISSASYPQKFALWEMKCHKEGKAKSQLDSLQVQVPSHVYLTDIKKVIKVIYNCLYAAILELFLLVHPSCVTSYFTTGNGFNTYFYVYTCRIKWCAWVYILQLRDLCSNPI